MAITSNSLGNANGYCVKCGGSGRIQAFRHIKSGVCFSCNGSGKVDISARRRENKRRATKNPRLSRVDDIEIFGKKHTVVKDRVTGSIKIMSRTIDHHGNREEIVIKGSRVICPWTIPIAQHRLYVDEIRSAMNGRSLDVTCSCQDCL